jgi:quercetin dioxygenase-like cupin family protein
MTGASLHDWRTTSIETVFTGITRQVVHGERQTLVRYIYEPGAVFPVHRHPEEQITIVLSGQIEFDVDGTPFVLGAGQVAIIPADVPHGAKVVGNETVETFNMLSPRRTSSPYAASGGVPAHERG